MGTTINSYSVAMGINTSGMVTGSKMARAEISQLSGILRASKPDSQRLVDGINLIDKALAQGRISVKQYEQSLEHLRKKYGETEAAAKSASSAASLTAPLGNLASGAGFGGAAALLTSPAGAVAAGVGAIGLATKKALELQASAETTAASFEVLTGSIRDAHQMVAAMKKLDAESSLSFVDFQQAAKVALGYGLAVESVMPSLKQLGDISMGNVEKFHSLSLAFSQVQANGRLMGQEVLQMVNAGFNPLQEISRTTGISMIQLKKDMEAGLITAKMVSGAINSATEEGGRFFGMSEKMAATAAGQWAKTVSELQAIGTEMGEHIMPVAIDMLKIFREMLPIFKAVNWYLEGISMAWRVSAGIVSDVIDDIKELERMDLSNLGDFKHMNAALDDILHRHQDIEKQVEAVTIARRAEFGAVKEIAELEKASKTLRDSMIDTRLGNAKELLETMKAIQDVEDSAEEARLKKSQSFHEELKALQKQIDLYTLGERAVREMELATKGYNQEQIAALEELRRQLQTIEQIKAAEEQKSGNMEETARMVETLKDQGKALTEKHSPVEAVKKQLADLMVLLGVNAIDFKTFALEQNRIVSEAAKNGKSDVASPASVDVGSQEAYKFLTDSQNDRLNQQLQKMEEQKILQQATVTALKNANETLTAIKDGNAKRIR